MQLDPTTDESFMAFLPGRQQEDDRALIVDFFVDKKLLGLKSKEAGRPVYEDREYVRIRIKGQDKQEVVREVDAKIKARFPIAYQLFQQQKPAPMIGTPIDMLPGLGPSLAHHLKGLNIRSVEDLSMITDENVIQNIGSGARKMIDQAKQWVRQTSETVVNTERLANAAQERATLYENENAALRARIAEFEAERESRRDATVKETAPRKARQRRSVKH